MKPTDIILTPVIRDGYFLFVDAEGNEHCPIVQDIGHIMDVDLQKIEIKPKEHGTS